MLSPDNLCILVVLDHNIRHISEFDIFTIPPIRLKYENFLYIYVANFNNIIHAPAVKRGVIIVYCMSINLQIRRKTRKEICKTLFQNDIWRNNFKKIKNHKHESMFNLDFSLPSIYSNYNLYARDKPGKYILSIVKKYEAHLWGQYCFYEHNFSENIC